MQASNQYAKAQYLDSYDNFEEVMNNFKPLKNINAALEPNASFFLIRAPTKDNVHRAIKYGVWTSSSRNNQKLNEAQQPVYLLFNIIQQSCFIGLAKIVSPFREKTHFKYWCEENKWFGTFQIEWIFIKDIPYINMKQIKQSSGKSIHELIDCTQLEGGDEIYDIYSKAEQKSSLFQFFKELDLSEQKKRKDRDNNQIFEQQFQEYISVFESMPFSFSVASYQRRKQQQQQYEYYNQYAAYYYQTPYQGIAQASFFNNQQQNPQGFYQHHKQKQQEEPQEQEKQQQQQFTQKPRKQLRDNGRK